MTINQYNESQCTIFFFVIHMQYGAEVYNFAFVHILFVQFCKLLLSVDEYNATHRNILFPFNRVSMISITGIHARRQIVTDWNRQETLFLGFVDTDAHPLVVEASSTSLPLVPIDISAVSRVVSIGLF